MNSVINKILKTIGKDTPLAGPLIQGLEHEIKKFFGPNRNVLNKGSQTRSPSKGAIVRSVQSRLAALGYTLDVDEIYGPETFAAVTEFQVKAGLEADGICGKETLVALFGSQD